MDAANFKPEHFLWALEDGVATVTLNRPDRKNPLTFESYAELGETFRGLSDASDVRAVVITGAGENFCSGGDVHEIIGPLVERDKQGLLEFTKLTGALVYAIQSCPQVVVAAIDGVCVGAGAAVAMASDIRFGTEQSKVAFLFVKVGLSGCDMGACAMLPRIIGSGRAAELLYTGRTMGGQEAFDWGFYNRLLEPSLLLNEAMTFAKSMAEGPTFAHSVTKRMLIEEWNMDLKDALDAEAREQALCMETKDFARAYHAFVNKQKPKFEGN